METTSVRANTQAGSTLCCFLAIAFVAAWMVLIMVGWVVLEDLSRQGEVLLPADPSSLKLTGSPNDTIRIRLLELDSEVVVRHADIHATFEHSESNFHSRIGLPTTSDGFSRQLLHAVLSVPELPERESGVLTGTLYGRVEFEQGPPAILEVPLQVQVAPKGQITTSGARVPALSIAAANLLFAVVMLGSSAAMGIGFWWLDKQETTQFVDQEKG